MKSIPQIESKLGYSFKDPQLLLLAFIHRSYLNEHKEITENNERLEFLGDSVLSVLISSYLFTALPKTPEGTLSFLRSRLVDSACCSLYMQKLQLDQYVLLGKGERMNDGRGRETILADLFEAIIGAIFIDGGLEEAKKFLFHHFRAEIQQVVNTPVQNWKAILQDFCQKKFQKPPSYSLLNEEGPDHSRQFTIVVAVENIELGRGQGTSKKEAQQAAAYDAVSKINPPLS